MTTATNEMFASRAVRPATAPSALLSVVSFLLGVNLRDTLAAQSTDVAETVVARGL